MKYLQTIIKSCLAGSIILASCHKDDSATVAPATTSPGATTTIARSVVQAVPGVRSDSTASSTPKAIYMLQTIASANSMVQWNTGYLDVSMVSFTGNHVNGNEIRKQTFSATAYQKYDLFTQQTPVVIGAVDMEGGTYYEPLFGMNISTPPPMPEAKTTAGSIAALYLSGTYSMNGRNIEIEFMVTTSVSLTASRANPLILSALQQSDTTNLSLNLDVLTISITPQMMNNAVIQNNVLSISSSSNPALYQLMANNFQYLLQANAGNTQTSMASN
jgi:hypothetical protein